ncbi:hypothetical protein EMCG_00595 [[Emmonsia] crescens]|uniref:Rhodopsin domain-containing protein n=1 Tax=[Emmonsia] crescens TaxID=73230 RepID=A0A0G2J830_9EURO|nr:hypothetical protein EMCG_00595 [Emmonsia crescens UAMH 3008]
MPGGFHPPLSVIKSWPKPNYIDPPAKGHELVAISLSLGILATVAVVARIWVRVKIQKNPGLDDLFLVLSIKRSVSNVLAVGTKTRWHRHIWDVTPDSVVGRQYHSWVVQMLFVFATCFAKVSTLLLYKRVVQSTSRRLYMIIVNIALGILAMYGITFVVLMAMQCQPTEAYWMQFSYPVPYTKEFKCMFEGITPISNAIISVITDFITALLPMLLFTQLRIPKVEKIALSILFGVAFLICMCGIVRTVIIRRLCYESYDVTWGSHDLWVWITIETDLLIFCSAIPPLKCLFNGILHPSQGSKNSENVRLAKLGQFSNSNYRQTPSDPKGSLSDDPTFGPEDPHTSESKLVSLPFYKSPEPSGIVVTKTHTTWQKTEGNQV